MDKPRSNRFDKLKEKIQNAIDEEGKKQYRKLRNEIIRRSKKEKEEYLNEICEKINRELIVDNLDKAYGMVKKFFGEGKKKGSVIKDEKEQLLYEEKEIVSRWKEYLQKLYGDEPMNENNINNEEQIEDNIGEDILRGEFDKAMEELKNKKAPGIDEIPTKLLKNCGEKAKDVLFKIISSIYKTGQIPGDFTKCLIILIPKKARAQTCDQYRTLSLISHASS